MVVKGTAVGDHARRVSKGQKPHCNWEGREIHHLVYYSVTPLSWKGEVIPKSRGSEHNGGEYRMPQKIARVCSNNSKKGLPVFYYVLWLSSQH